MLIRKLLTVLRWPVGGIRTYLKYVYPILDRQLGGVQFTLIAPPVEEFEVLQKDLSGLNVRYVPVWGPNTVKTLALSVNSTLTECAYDLVHSHGFSAAVSASLPAKARGVPHLTTVHDVLHDWQISGLRGAPRRLGLRVALSLVDVVQAVGEDAGRNLIDALGGRLASHVRVVRNGILAETVLRAAPGDLRSELSLPADVFLIGFFGRFMAQKGFRYLMEAIRLSRDRRFSKSCRPFHVVSFGGGGFIREEKAVVERLGLGSCFTFLPFVPDIASALKSVDVVTMPSLWEAMPLLPMEAMIAGVPIIGTSCTGLREVLADTPARVIPPGDAAALAAALEAEAKASSRQAAERFVAQAVERFDVTRTVSKLSQLMEELVAVRKSGRQWPRSSERISKSLRRRG